MPLCFDAAVVPSAYRQYLLFAIDPNLKEWGFKPETPVAIAKYACNVREYLDPPLVQKLAAQIRCAGDPADRDINEQIVDELLHGGQ